MRDLAGRLRLPAPRALAAGAGLLLLAAPGGARCYPEGTRVVVFLQGLYTVYDAEGTQWTGLEPHRFGRMKDAFAARGYERAALLDFSYAGGTVSGDGTW